MNSFTQKLKLIYTKLLNENIDQFTEAFIDTHKFDKHKWSHKAKQLSRQAFFLNRKTVLRRWLLKGIDCTADFKKSFKHYQIAQYQFRGEALFRLEDFTNNDNLPDFERKINAYLHHQQRAYINTDYCYIYAFNQEHETIYSYTITQWIKGEHNKTIIEVEYNNHLYKGTFSLREDNNIFITLQIATNTLYLLFHDNNDSSSNYIVGMSMGYLAKDNKVPRAEKVILAKEKLDTQESELPFILNETESISAIENRLNLNTQGLKINHFVKYSNIFKKYHNLFVRLIAKKFQQNFYYRLAFKEFYAFHRLFEKVSNQESYFIFNYQRAFFELIETLEAIGNIPVYIVMEFHENNLFLQSTHKDLTTKERFFNLSNHGIERHLIFIVDSLDMLSVKFKKILKELEQHNIKVRVVTKETIVHKVNSLDFFFIHVGDERDFVLADPIRDNKDVFKIFTNDITMDEYRTDYKKIFEKSKLLDLTLN